VRDRVLHAMRCVRAVVVRVRRVFAHSQPRGAHAGLDLFQTLSLFQVMHYPFPPAVETTLRVFQLSTISVQLVAPQVRVGACCCVQRSH
jgi:hypothetical protein